MVSASTVRSIRRKIAARVILIHGDWIDCARRAHACLVTRRGRPRDGRFSALFPRGPQQYRARRAITNCRQACRCHVCVFACTLLGHHNRRACTIVLSAIDFGKHRLVRSSNVRPSTRETRTESFRQLDVKRIAMRIITNIRSFFRTDNYLNQMIVSLYFSCNMYVLLVSYCILKVELLAETIMQIVILFFNLQREERLASFFLCWNYA